MAEARTFHIATLGCKINQYESQALREAWTGRGWTECDDPAGAAVVLVSACAVTARAVSDARKLVRQMARQAPEARLVVTGCAAQVLGADMAALPGVDAVVPQGRKADLLADPLADGPPQAAANAPSTSRAFPDFRVRGAQRSRPVCKVQDGCSHCCTYCIVPLARGRAASREPAEVCAEVRAMFEAGYGEVVLSGINLGQYGRGLTEKTDFWDLLALLDRDLGPQWAGRARLRLSSLDPGMLGPKALDVLAASRLACPHLHLSLQSLAPSVLSRMGRAHYGPSEVAGFVADLARIWPVFGLVADLLVGFPGETDEEFEACRQAVAALPLTYAHVFPYSRRPGTRAADMPGQTPHAVKKARAAALRALAGERRAVFARALAGLPRLTVAVLGDGRGLTEHYAHCRLRGGDGLRPGALAEAAPTGAPRGRLEARATGKAV